jgi:iron complex transport system ATP-binding protein
MQPLEHLNRENGVTILMALHDIQYTAWFSRWLVVMQEGRVVVQGVPAEVLTAELMVDVFGMKVRIYPEEEAGHLLCIVLGSRSDATPRS